MDDEQIIKNVTDEAKQPKQVRQKDPKKVAAGKALARKNAEGRKAKKDDTSSPAGSAGLAPHTSTESLSFFDINNDIQTVAGFVGAGFVLYHGWKFFTSSMNNRESYAVEATRPGEAAEGTRPSEPKQSNTIDMD